MASSSTPPSPNIKVLGSDLDNLLIRNDKYHNFARFRGLNRYFWGPKGPSKDNKLLFLSYPQTHFLNLYF